MDIASYRRSAETFIEELEREFYRHYAGLKDDYEIESIYARHAELFEQASVQALHELAQAAPQASDERRRLTVLLDFAVDGLIGQATKELQSELARREATLSIELEDERIGFRESAAVQANEDDPQRREAIELARAALIESQLNPLYREVVEHQHALARELGYGSYSKMCAVLKCIDLDALHRQTSEFAARSAGAYPSVLEPELQRSLGFGLPKLRRSDFPRFFRAAFLDGHFPEDRLLSSFVETMRGLGIDVGAQPGVVLDVERRPKKSPRAFCSPVRSPTEVYLVISPVGGRDDYFALFHEGGHTEHFANVDPELPFEYRHLGDNSVTEGYAFLFDHLVENPVWLTEQLGVHDPHELVGHARAQQLVYARRYAAKLAYELELHGSDGAVERFAPRYAELLGDALMVPWNPETYLADVDPGFYCACYLRAWALETHLRAYLEERFGSAWFRSPEAGATLRELWSQGQRLGADELLGELTGEALDFRVLLDDLALRGES